MKTKRSIQKVAGAPRENGYMLVAVVMILAVSLLITAGMLQASMGSSSIRTVAEKNTKNFYNVERTINTLTAWLQANSKNMVNAFNSANFATNFDLGDPVVGTNEGSAFAVPTM